MKKLLYISVVLLAAMTASCHHDEPELGVDFSVMPHNDKRFIPYQERDCNIETEQPWVRLEQEIAAEEQTQSPSAEHIAPRQGASSLNMTDMARGLMESLFTYNVHQVCGTYMSTDSYKEDICLSGAVFYPTKGRIKNVIICSHYTVAANYEVPSQTFPIEAVLAGLGYVVVMPDYIGYGASKDRVHPYLQAYVTAGNVIDMALAVRPFLAERNIKVESDSVILLGYSQGGATSMFVQLCMETLPEYMGKFKIKRNYCGGGPYNVARTYDYCVKLDETGIPYAVPMIILGMSEGMAKPLKIEYFFREPLLSHYQEWFNSKNYSGSQITALIGVNKLSKILTIMGTDRTQPETQRLYRELFNNSIPSSYTPKAPIYMFHSMDDQTVPFINAQIMHRNFQYNDFYDVEYDFDHYGNHQAGCIKFILKMVGKLK